MSVFLSWIGDEILSIPLFVCMEDGERMAIP